MPSVFVLDGARVSNIGAIAIPLGPGSRQQPTRGGYPEYGAARPGGTQVASIFTQVTNPVTATIKGLGNAVSTGFGEISPGAKTGLIALGALAVVGLVAYHGGAGRRRGLRGSRRRRRR